MSHHDDHTLARIERKLDHIMREMKIMANELQDLQTQVEASTSAEQSAVVLLDGIKKKLDDAIASNNPAELKALSSALGTSQAALAEAIVRNTPADPAGGGTPPSSRKSGS